MKTKSPWTFGILFAAFALAPVCAQSQKDLGRMWTFENAPLQWFQSAYDFTPTPQWLEHARLSSLRFGTGCSASFVSPRGLIMTNQHCARDAISKAQGKNDWLKDGYYAGEFAAEVKLDGLTVQQLIATKDVTKEVQGGRKLDEIKADMKRAEPDLEHQDITLYQGGMYQIYSYKIWRDIRLVCAPHGQSAHFGGDPDNFCYPRWGLDFTFCRAYENDQPADTERHFFRWKTQGAGNGELVFVTGNPGSTGRLLTMAQCEFDRDVRFPTRLEQEKAALAKLYEEAKDPEKERVLRAEILRRENTRKAVQGYLDGLLDERIMAIKRTAEARIREAVAQSPELQAKYADAWTRIEALCQQKRALVAAKAKAEELAEIAKQEAEQNRRIGEAFFAVFGTAIPPDATFSLRLSDGVVKGYPMNGTIAPPFTSLYGLFARHTEFSGVHPFDLPKAWLLAKDKLDLKTPFNFVTTNDIIGGNSGSPMIDRDLRVVGLIFDGNIESLGNRYVFDDEVARTVSVHPAIIIEALRKVYGAGQLADELEQAPARTERKEPARQLEKAGR